LPFHSSLHEVLGADVKSKKIWFRVTGHGLRGFEKQLALSRLPKFPARTIRLLSGILLRRSKDMCHQIQNCRRRFAEQASDEA